MIHLRRVARVCLLPLLVACLDLVRTVPDAELTGEWDFDAARPGDEAGTCHVLGAMVLTQVDTAVSGTVTGYVSGCYTPSTGDISGGTVSGDTIAFVSGTCSHSGVLVGEPA